MLKVLQFFLHAENGVTIFIVLLIIKFDCFGIDITFNFTNYVKSYDFQNREELIKSPRSWTYTLGLKQNSTLIFFNSNKKCFLGHYFMKKLQEV